MLCEALDTMHSTALFDVNILGMDGAEKLQALLGHTKRMALSEPMAGCAEHDMNNPSYTSEADPPALRNDTSGICQGCYCYAQLSAIQL